MYACTFIGHSDCSEKIKPELCGIIEKMIVYESVNTFYVGTHGDFDRIVYEVLCEIEKKYKINVFVVLAYLRKGKEQPYYDMKKTIYPDILDNTPQKFAVSKRNLYMIEQSQYMVCCIDNTFSNSYTFVCKVARKKLNIINVGMYDISRIV